MIWRHWLGGGDGQIVKESLVVYDVQRHSWFWYNPEHFVFYACDQMTEEQIAVPTLVPANCYCGCKEHL